MSSVLISGVVNKRDYEIKPVLHQYRLGSPGTKIWGVTTPTARTQKKAMLRLLENKLKKKKKEKKSNYTCRGQNLTGIQFTELIEKTQIIKKAGTLTLKTDLFNNAKIFLLFIPCSSK